MMIVNVHLLLFLFLFFPALLFDLIYSQTHDLRDVKALIDYDKQLEVLINQFTGKLSELVGFSLLYHMREDRWKQGGDWEALDYTNRALDALPQKHGRKEYFNISKDYLDDVPLNNLNLTQVAQSLPRIKDMELHDALIIHKIRLSTILGRYSAAQALVQDTILLHVDVFGKDISITYFEEQLQLSKQIASTSEHADAIQQLQDILRYLLEYRGVLYFLAGQSWLSAGDAVSAIPWFEKAVIIHPCLHQAYYQLSQAIAASPWNNPQNQHVNHYRQDQRNIPNMETSIRIMMDTVENLLRHIYIDPDTEQVALLRSTSGSISASSSDQSLLSYIPYISSWFVSKKTLFSRDDHSSAASAITTTPVSVTCTFGDELQYFHILLKYSQVSPKSLNNEEDEEIDEDEHGGFHDSTIIDNYPDSMMGNDAGNLFQHAKVTLNAAHPAAFVQQKKQSSQNHGTSTSAQQPQTQKQEVSRDYVKVVQAACYWSLFTLADVLPDQEALAFFYLQQARALERFRVHHPLYSLYSFEESERQVNHIIRTFTQDYYPRPKYPTTFPIPKNSLAAKELPKLIFGNDTADESGSSEKRVQQSAVYFSHDFWSEEERRHYNGERLHHSHHSKRGDEDEEESAYDQLLYGSSIQRPVFIVGFFRSGSTLLETLLSKHDLVWGLGEHSAFATQMHRMQSEMLTLAERFEQQNNQQSMHSSQKQQQQKEKEHIRAMQEEMFRQTLRKHAIQIDDLMITRCAQYLYAHHMGIETNEPSSHDTNASNHKNSTKKKYSKNSTRHIPLACTRIIDKMLLNYRNIGLIHLLFPQAVILHTIRDPIDTLWSCMTHRFGDNAAYTLDYHLLVQEYLLYLQTMHHFRQTLPARTPLWGTRSIDKATATTMTTKKHMGNKKDSKKRTKSVQVWDNLALCDGRTKNTTDSLVWFCHQQRILHGKNNASLSNNHRNDNDKEEHREDMAEEDQLSLQPLIEVRYDMVVTRPHLILSEIQNLLQIPSPRLNTAEKGSGVSTNANEQQMNARTSIDDDNNSTTSSENTPAGNINVTHESGRNNAQKRMPEGPIRTASYLQVRRPVTQKAQGKWRRYAHLLRYNLLPMWRDTLLSYQHHHDKDSNNNDNNNNAKRNNSKKKKKKKRKDWMSLVPFYGDTKHNNSIDAMNWWGEESYDYAGHLQQLADLMDELYHVV